MGQFARGSARHDIAVPLVCVPSDAGSTVCAITRASPWRDDGVKARRHGDRSVGMRAGTDRTTPKGGPILSPSSKEVPCHLAWLTSSVSSSLGDALFCGGAASLRANRTSMDLGAVGK